MSADLGIFSVNGLAAGTSIGSQVGVQITGIVSTGFYTAILTGALLKLVAALTGGLRVDEEQEQQGLDISDHEEKGYYM